MRHKTYIIAEAGVNHNGQQELAKKMVYAAAEAGADAVKFQTFKADQAVSYHAGKAEYQKATGLKEESQLEMVRRFELDEAVHLMLTGLCGDVGIEFLSSPFDLESISLLDRLGLLKFKIPSGEITNLPYLRAIGHTGKNVIMSTGMSNLGEIDTAVAILLEAGTPFSGLTLLHCNTEYPTPFEDVNLRAMLTIKNAFPGLTVGYSDHSAGIEIPIAAVALGAGVIEKHFTLDRNMDGPDHRASLEPDEFKSMTTAIRNTEKALGDGWKRPSLSESKNIDIVRKSIVASKAIAKGERFTEKNITVKRPGTGISPMHWDETIGKRATRSYDKDDFIDA